VACSAEFLVEVDTQFCKTETRFHFYFIFQHVELCALGRVCCWDHVNAGINVVNYLTPVVFYL